jgi:Ni/Co efflux regulator RcnB
MKYLISTAIALALLGSSAALAQPGNPYSQGQNTGPWQNSGGPGDRQDFNHHNWDQPHWSRGDRLSTDYRSDQYVVSDWRGHHLRKPPRHHHWVHVHGRYMLVRIGNGLIVDVYLGGR